MSAPAPVTNAIASYLSAELGQPIEIGTVETTPLLGGCVAERVTRLDISYTTPGQQPSTRSFVQKYASEPERTVTRLLKPLCANCALPFFIAEGEDALGCWLLMPFLHGTPLEGFWLPAGVVHTLVAVHAHFAAQLAALTMVPRVDGGFWILLLELVTQALPGAPWPSGAAARAEIQRGIGSLQTAECVPSALDSLPATLLHGDVHCGNMIASSTDGKTYLFDWGSTRMGPAALDLVNCVDSIEAAAWLDYWAQFARISAEVPSLHARAATFHLGKAIINIQYMPYAISTLGQARATAMIRDALASVQSLRAFNLANAQPI